MRLIRILTGFLFVLLMILGLWIASHRPLWNDEYYSLIISTLGASYKSIISGFIREGNNSPLFYILQKVQYDLFSYHPPQEWVKGHWGGLHPGDQFFLRIQSVIFISMALSVLFYYFSRRNSLAIGMYALAVAMTSSLLWVHWTEARPYAAWFALSIFQILLLLNILEDTKDQNKKNWRYLILVHWLLALTSIISGIQIMAAGIVLWMFHRSKLLVYVPLILIPLGICSFYYIRAPHFNFFFLNGPIELINANIPKDRLFIIFVAAIISISQYRLQNWTVQLEIKYLVFFLLILGSFGLVLFKLKHAQTEVHHGFQIPSRYFLSLTPAGIVGTVLFSEYLIRAISSKIWRTAVMVVLVCFLVYRFEKMIQHVPTSMIVPTLQGF